MPGDFEYSKFYSDAISNAGGSITMDPIDIKRTIAQLGTLIGGVAVNSNPTVTTPTLGAAAQLANKTVVQQLYIDVTAAGNLVVAIGPTAGVANTLFSGTSAIQCITVRLPAGWYIAVTTSNTATWTTTAVTG